MAITRSDEVLDKALASDKTVVPRYDIVNSNGQVVVQNAELILKNPILSEGTVINKQVLDECLAASGETTGTAEQYKLHQPNFGLIDGALIRFKLHTNSGANPTINVNNTGAKAIMQNKYKPMRAGIAAGTWLTAIYSSTLGFFVLQSSEIEEEASGTTTGTSTAYTLAQSGFVLKDGATVRFKLHVDSGATPTLNINNTGAKAIMQNKYKPMRAGVSAGVWLTVIYSSTLDFFVLQGSGENTYLRYGNSSGQVSAYEIYQCGHNNPFYTRKF